MKPNLSAKFWMVVFGVALRWGALADRLARHAHVKCLRAYARRTHDV